MKRQMARQPEQGVSNDAENATDTALSAGSTLHPKHATKHATAAHDVPIEQSSRRAGAKPSAEHVADTVPSTGPLPHPERVHNLLTAAHDNPPEQSYRRVSAKAKPSAFDKRKADVDARQEARLAAEQDRRDRQIERERHRKIMSRAVNGQRKLGRESTVLLDKVKRMMKHNN